MHRNGIPFYILPVRKCKLNCHVYTALKHFPLHCHHEAETKTYLSHPIWILAAPTYARKESHNFLSIFHAMLLRYLSSRQNYQCSSHEAIRKSALHEMLFLPEFLILLVTLRMYMLEYLSSFSLSISFSSYMPGKIHHFDEPPEAVGCIHFLSHPSEVLHTMIHEYLLIQILDIHLKTNVHYPYFLPD